MSRLQQTVGNHGLHRLLRSRAIQPKLTAAPEDDEYHREEEERAVQTRPASRDPGEVPSGLESYLARSGGSGHPLSDSARHYLEPRFGHDFSRVRVHTDGEAGTATRALNARAFTVGQDIYFAPALYDPGSTSGRRLLSHELTHVVQQGHARDQLRRQPENCPPSRHEQADHPGTCPAIKRESGERSRFARSAPTLRAVTPLQCYVIENLGIGKVDFGVLPALDDIADFLTLNPGVTVHLTGFTDCLGAPSANANLRTNRASAVEDYFIAVLGVDRSRVFVEFAGDAEYLAANNTAIGRAANRAVAIYLESGLAIAPPPQPTTTPSPPAARPPATLTDAECALQVAQGLGTAWLAALPNCPCTTALLDRENATLSGNDAWIEGSFFLDCFHPGAARCFRRVSGTHGQQCCYDAAGNLITGGAAVGTPDFAPAGDAAHQSTDVWTWTILGWQRYLDFWVPNNGNRCRKNVVTTPSNCQGFHTAFANRPATCAP